MEKYLVEDLSVPRDRIQRLLGQMGQKTADNSTTPTRANIVRTLYSLIDNPDITCRGNIMIHHLFCGKWNALRCPRILS